jgi:hypothetical protein
MPFSNFKREKFCFRYPIVVVVVVVDVVDGDGAVTAPFSAANATGVELVLDNLVLFLEFDSESSSSLSVSFLVELRLLCLFRAGDPVLDPLDVTEEGVPALEVVFVIDKFLPHNR